LAWGALRSNECPANYFRIVDVGACRNAAAAAGKAYPYGKNESDGSRPKGCYGYYYPDTEKYVVNFNTHSNGATGSSTMLLCSGAHVNLKPIVGLVENSQGERPKRKQAKAETALVGMDGVGRCYQRELSGNGRSGNAEAGTGRSGNRRKREQV
jgi:hypothetical protein